MIYFLGGVVKSHLSDVPPFMYDGGTYIYEDVKNPGMPLMGVAPRFLYLSRTTPREGLSLLRSNLS